MIAESLFRRLLSGDSITAKITRVMVLTSAVPVIFATLVLTVNDIFATRRIITRNFSVMADLIAVESVAPLYFWDPVAGAAGYAGREAFSISAP